MSPLLWTATGVGPGGGTCRALPDIAPVWLRFAQSWKPLPAFTFLLLRFTLFRKKTGSGGREPKFLSENLTIADAGKGGRYLFLFPRSSAEEVEQIVEDLRERVGGRGLCGVDARLEPQTSATS